MRSMPISEFKAHALRVIDEVARSRVPLLITKRGKPLAEVVPYPATTTEVVPGGLAEYLVFEEDIVTPLGAEMWEATR